MEREVKHYLGSEIDMEVISKLFAISAIRGFKVEGVNPYEEIESIDDLGIILNSDINNIHVILGTDWFITYLNNKNEIEILEWASIKKETGIFRQTLEMLKYMISILLESKNHQIKAVMRHSTSYKFYKLLKENGYIEETYDNLGLEDTIPLSVIEDTEIPLSKLKNLTEFLETYPNTEYSEYIHHDLKFSLTPKFYARYNKTK